MSSEQLEIKTRTNTAATPPVRPAAVKLEPVAAEVAELADAVAAKLLDPNHSFVKKLRKLVTLPGMFGDTP